MRGASSRPPGPNGDDLAVRGLSLGSVRNDDAWVPSFTVKSDDRGADLLIKTPLDPKLDGDRLHRNTKGHDPQSAAHLWIFQNGPLR